MKIHPFFTFRHSFHAALASTMLTVTAVFCLSGRAESAPLIDLGAPSARLNLLAAQHKGQELGRETVDGRQAARIHWKGAAGTMATVELLDNPLLLAAEIDLEIDVNNRDFPNLTSVGLVLIDANGMSWQFGGLNLQAGHDGWQPLRVDLRNRQNVTSWGDREVSNGHITPPMRLTRLLFKARGGHSDDARKIYVGEIRRSRIDPDTVGPEIAQQSVPLFMHSDMVESRRNTTIPQVRKSQEEKWFFRAENPAGGLPTEFRLRLNVTYYEAEPFEWLSDPVRLAPGESVDIPASAVLREFGWYSVEPALQTLDASGTVRRKPRVLLYMNEPVGSRELPPSDDF